jgi:hypothetical protein
MDIQTPIKTIDYYMFLNDKIIEAIFKKNRRKASLICRFHYNSSKSYFVCLDMYVT